MRSKFVATIGAAVMTLAGAGMARAATVPPAIAAAVSVPTRSAKFVARDKYRHPAEELAFFGVKPSSTVVEIWPGPGYWTQILAPLLHDQGTYYVAMGSADGSKLEQEWLPSAKFRAMLAKDPEIYDRVKFSTLTVKHPDPAPPDSADFVLTFRNLHNWMQAGDTAQMLAGIHKALKPGGIFGVEDHRGNTTAPQDPKAENGYVRQAYAIRLIEKAGFKFVGSSEIDANPKDTANWPEGVWTLPPSFALGAKDHAKYAAIGEADNFVLKFRKVGH